MRNFVAIDTETALIAPDDPVPPLSCLTWFAPGFSRGERGIAGHTDAAEAFFDLCIYALETGATIVAHNLPYDLAALLRECPALTTLVYFLLDRGQLECTLVREVLWAIGRGDFTSHDGERGRYVDGVLVTFALDSSMKLRRGVFIDKSADTWRMRYGELRGVPVSQWPKSAVDYAIDDAMWHWKLAVAQEEDEAAMPVRHGHYVYADAPRQTRAAWALMPCRMVGMRTDRVQAAMLAENIERRLQRELQDLIGARLVRPAKVRPRKGDVKPPEKDTKAIAALVTSTYERMGREVPRNDPTEAALKKDARAPGSVCCDKLSLETGGVYEPLLLALGRYNKADKIRQFGQIMKDGYKHPIHSEPNVLVETGRTSWKRPNLQQLPKEEGTRECFVPTEGYYLASIDYAQLELCALGQYCLWMFGESRMAEMINADMDLHCALGAQYRNEEYADFLARKIAKDKPTIKIRNFSKEGNFGFGGGMGEDRFIDSVWAKDYLRDLRDLFTLENVKRLKRAWMTTFPEMERHFAAASRISRGSRQDVQLASGRIRGKLGFCDAANGKFQALAADGAKDALYALTRAMWAEPSSPLFGSRMLVFVHDEFVFEVPIDRAHEAVTEAYRIAMARMTAWMPDIKIKGSVALMERWRKEADEFYVDGRLVPWERSPGFKAMYL